MDQNNKSVITCDLDGKVETFSEGAEQLFGYASNDVIGKLRVSDFSDGLVVLGHVVKWLKIAVEKGEWSGDTVFLDKAKKELYDILIIDTAGRQVVNNEMMDELKLISDISNPIEIAGGKLIIQVKN